MPTSFLLGHDVVEHRKPHLADAHLKPQPGLLPAALRPRGRQLATASADENTSGGGDDGRSSHDGTLLVSANHTHLLFLVSA